VAEVGAAGGAQLLGVEAEGAGMAEQAPAELARLTVGADLREGGDEPERADQERPLTGAAEAVVGLLGAVAEDEPVLGQLVGDRYHRPLDTPVGRGEEP